MSHVTSTHSAYSRPARGFTLLEVLIALVIFSTATLVILQQSSRSVLQQAHLEDKTIALWVAENQLASMRLNHPWPAAGRQTLEKTSAQRDWLIEQLVEETALPTLRKITIQVSRKDMNSPLVSLQSFMGEH